MILLGYRVGMVDLSGSTSWTYNQRGQVTAESKTVTGLFAGGTFTTQWAYNSAGMLTQMTYPGGNNGEAGETVYYGYTTSYFYDGDGNRVKRVEYVTKPDGYSETSLYTIGNYYEYHQTEFQQGELHGTSFGEENYIYAGAQRIAKQVKSKITYLIGDHLGSTSLMVYPNGTLITEQRYKPFGESRYRATSGFPTDFQFTGQRWEASTGLYDYVARMYDPVTGHFISADTVFDGFDRYGYVKNNPIRYSDPTGHLTEDEVNEYICSQDPSLCDGSLDEFFSAIHFEDNLIEWGKITLKDGKLIITDGEKELDLSGIFRSSPLGLTRTFGDKEKLVYIDYENTIDFLGDEFSSITSSNKTVDEKDVEEAVTVMMLEDTLDFFVEIPIPGVDDIKSASESIGDVKHNRDILMGRAYPGMVYGDQVTITRYSDASDPYNNWIETTVIRNGNILTHSMTSIMSIYHDQLPFMSGFY